MALADCRNIIIAMKHVRSICSKEHMTVLSSTLQKLSMMRLYVICTTEEGASMTAMDAAGYRAFGLPHHFSQGYKP